MALATCGDADVLGMAAHLPGRGAWFAKLTLDTATAPSGQVTIAATGGLTLKGTVITGGVFCDVARVYVVGGAGGLRAASPTSAYQNAQLRDPLNAVLKAAGETLSATTSESVLAVLLDFWTVPASRTSLALDGLCRAASAAIGSDVVWRVLDDGTIWMGAETWPAAQLPFGADVLDFFPDEGRYVIGVDTPALLPGVNLDGVGQVAAVDHWLSDDEVRTWAWV